ncbi:hypothetical protein [Micromonospora auratinigra]|uniref:Uncharacterized protein n=1 Tax=Micromonospora auratinigra TaxID=261654 RepID=A0A1A9A8W9_9ACTN|nr:hypothetical protein [Micromonospora auratinigra]SBT52607.1 hypothetical protein GA0070611_5706 [Micromonospora auratinigra]
MTTTNLLPPPAATRRAWPAYALPAWAVGYGLLRAVWLLAGAPSFGPLGTDLVVFTGGWPLVLCAAAGVVGVGLARARSWRPGLVGAAGAVCAALLVSGALFLLDLVGFLIGDLTAAFTPAGFLGRAGAVTGALLLAAAALGHVRRFRGDCGECGRTRRSGGPVPGWARIAARVAVAGCLIRLAAQVAVGFGDVPLTRGASMAVFEVGFLLAGVLLPLALVHHWGTVWPGWVPLLAGRRVPPMLLLVPAYVFGVGLVGYFGVGLGQLAVETVTGSFDPGDGRFPLSFFWVAESGYWAWGWGLLAAATAHRRRTRRPCRHCGR